MTIPEIAFGNLKFHTHIGGGSYSSRLTDVASENIEDYRAALKKDGFTLFEKRMLGKNTFYAYKNGDDAVFLTYCPTVGEATVVSEPHSPYFSFNCKAEERVTVPSITQVDLKDFGMSYVIRLPDGRFVIIDGGWDFEEDAISLKACLDTLTEGRPIIISAWLMTHPHIDHYRCFFPFMKMFADDVTLELVMHAFPDTDEAGLENAPVLLKRNDYLYIEQLFNYLREHGIPTVRCHTGQLYRIGDSSFEILESPDNTFLTPLTNTNLISVTAMMTLADTRVLWCADAQYNRNNFTKIYGDYLKCDIMQIPHHGFNGGTHELVRLAAAPTCLNPSFEYDTFEKHSVKYAFMHDIWESPVTQDLLTGSHGDVTIPLPYTPRKNGRALLDDLIKKYAVTRDSIIDNS